MKKKMSRTRKLRKLADLSVPSRRKSVDVNGGHFDPFLKIEAVAGEKSLKSSR
jgi:hypothetical protein